MTLRVNKDELSWVAPSARTGNRVKGEGCQSPRDDTRVVMNALRANPCSLNLVPPAKKHKPRTCAHWSSQVSQCGRSGRSPIGSLTNTIDKERWFRVSKRCSTGGLMCGMKLTEVTQDGADEGRLDHAELAFHERKDLQN